MLTLTPLTLTAIEIVTEGAIAREDLARILAEIDLILEKTDRLDIFADVRGKPDIHLNLITEELKHLPTLFRLMRAIERIAVVADESWIRSAAKIESRLIPGVTYEVYPRAEASHARAWILRETDRPHPI